MKRKLFIILALAALIGLLCCGAALADEDPLFTLQPTGGTVIPEGSLKISWATNFTPTLVEILHYEGSDEQYAWKVESIEEDLAWSMSSTLPYDQWSGTDDYYVRAYYNTTVFGSTVEVHIESEPFHIEKAPRIFNAQPTGGTVIPEGSLKISWATNFTPIRVDIGYYYGLQNDNEQIIETIDDDLSRSMSHVLEYDDAVMYTNGSPDWFVRAYYEFSVLGSTVQVPIESTAFLIDKLPRAFTRQPIGGDVPFGDAITIKWSLNFTPVQVEIGYHYGPANEYTTIVDTLTERMARSMSYNLSYDDVAVYANGSPDWFVCAYYETRSPMMGTFQLPLYSNAFLVNRTENQFTVQPTGETIYPWTTHILHWATNFIPTKIEIGAVYSGYWRSAVTITDGLSKSMSCPLTYDQVHTSDWTIRAWYGETYISSNEFDIVKAANYYCGSNLLGTFDNGTGTLTITGIGTMYNYYAAPYGAPWHNIRTQIRRIVIGEGVTYIGKHSFDGCTNLSQATLPPSIEAVGHSAFLNCTGLRYAAYSGFKSQWDAIDIDGGNTDLLNASVSYLHRSGRLGTTDVYYELIGRDGSLWIYGSGGSTVHVTPPWYDVAQYITEIRVDIDTLWEDAFRDCTGVKKVYLSEGLTTVQDGAFNDCTRLTDIYYDSTKNDWDSIEILGHNAPLLNAALHTAPHEEQLTGDLSWSVNDEGLLRIWLDDDLMGDGEDTAIPDYTSYTDAPWYADYKDVITSLRIESGVTSIGKNAFRALPHLRTITIADTVTGIGDIAFASCTSLEDFTLPDSIETIGANAFMNCDYLELIHLPDSITFLGVGAFRDCGNLEKVWLPGQLTTILSNTFMDCPLLDHIDIPAAVTAVNDNAFWNCIELASSTGHVYYGGHSAQWKQITIGTGNTQLLNCPNIHFDPEELRIDEENFPDTEFRSYVLANFDTDSTGYLTDREISNVQVIQCGALEIASLAGIEYFTRLEELDCHNNLLQELDLSANTKLQKLVCSENALTELSLSALPDLYYLNCAGNQLAELDVSHQMLEVLYCMDNQLTVLDLSGQALGLLDCRNNPLTLLNLSGQTQLEILSSYGTNLAALDLRGCPQLLNAVQNGAKASTADYVQYQYVDNKLELILRLRVDTGTELIIPGMIAVDAVHFPDEAFRLWVSDIADRNSSGWLSEEEIDAIGEIYLNVSAFAGLISVQGIEYFPDITELIIFGTPELTSLDLSGNTRIESLELIDTGLTSLTLGNQPEMSSLFCYGNDLTALDITGCPHLVNVYHSLPDTSRPEYDSYTSGDNVLYVSKGMRIEAGDPAPTFTLPAAMTTIEAEAFSGIAAEAVLIPAGVTGITGDPFSGSSVRCIYGSTGLVRDFAQAYGYVFVPVRD